MGFFHLQKSGAQVLTMKKSILIYSLFLLLAAGCVKDVPLIPPDRDPCLSTSDQEFKVTIDFEFGNDDFSYGPVGHPLALSNPSMHWSWSQGYLFAKIEGSYDPNEITGTYPGNNFHFHVGEFSSHQKTFVEIPISEVISACGTNTVRLKIELEKVFTDINLETENNTAT